MNSPSVRISNGRASNITMGRMKALRMPSTSEVTNGVSRLLSVKWMPGTMYTVTSTANVLMAQLWRNLRSCDGWGAGGGVMRVVSCTMSQKGEDYKAQRVSTGSDSQQTTSRGCGQSGR